MLADMQTFWRVPTTLAPLPKQEKRYFKAQGAPTPPPLATYNDPLGINLDQWKIYEQENPYTFLQMYQFWISK